MFRDQFFQYWRWIILALFLMLAIPMGINQALAGRTYHNVYLGDQDISWTTNEEMEGWLIEQQQRLSEGGVTFSFGEETYRYTLEEVGVRLDIEETLEQIDELSFAAGSLVSLSDQISLLARPEYLEPVFQTQTESLQSVVKEIVASIDQAPTDAVLTVDEAGELLVVPGDIGYEVQVEMLTELIYRRIQELQPVVIAIPYLVTEPQIQEQQIETLLLDQQAWVGASIEFVHEDSLWTVEPTELKHWLQVQLNENDQMSLSLNSLVGQEALWQRAEQGMNIHPKDAVFEVQNGKVTRFEFSADGWLLNTEATLTLVDELVAQSLNGSERVEPLTRQVELVMETVLPQVNTAQSNELGIQEVIAEGTSYYRGSSWARSYNLGNATNLVNGVIIPPGEEFSFNEHVGAVSEVEGFVEGLIISGGRTVPGVGGGVCQSSTTVFRMAINAGLPITERHPHSYRVSYYEGAGAGYEHGKPGMDAAIFSPYSDLKFLNDTGNHLMLLTHNDPNQQKLTYTLYGTNDGRQVSVTQPVITSTTPPPPTQYIDRPDMPSGWVKQVDWAVPGSTTVFSRTVTYADGRAANEDFYTNYRAWSAKYERGTAGR